MFPFEPSIKVCPVFVPMRLKLADAGEPKKSGLLVAVLLATMDESRLARVPPE
jgi:hypothetical protein